jgi:hypothetical protein
MATQTQPEGRAAIRQAADHTIELPPQPGQAHRSGGGKLIDYNLQPATGDRVRAIATVEGHFANTPEWGSPWHFHECDLQIALIIDGSLEVAYERDRYSRAVAGDILFIPGQTLHDVGSASTDYQVAEITFPGTFGTIEADAPAAGAPTAGRTLAPRDAWREEDAGGLIAYRYDLAAPHDASFAIRRYVASRTSGCDGAVRRHGDAYRMLYVMKGWVDLALAGEAPVRTPRQAVATIPADTDYAVTASSDDLEVIEIALRR